KTWEPNFVADLTAAQESDVKMPPLEASAAGFHDFDWEFGDWNDHVRRLKDPLTASDQWFEMNGAVTQRKVWNGRANLAEVELDGPKGHLQFIALRLYNPQAKQWSVNFASSSSGRFGTPMVGEFQNGRGEFYDQEDFNGRMILARFLFLPAAHGGG